MEDLTSRRSLPAAWAEVWGAGPSAPLIYDVGAGPDARWITAGELDERTRRAAGVMQGLGLHAGDRLLWSTGSSVAAVVANLAALRAGLVVVPANAAYTARELTHIVTDVRPAAAVVDDPQRARWVAEAATTPVVVLSVDLQVLAGQGRGWASTPSSESTASPAGSGDGVGLDASDPADPALIGYTSGTTGAPKGAVLSHGNLLANSETVALTWRWQPDDRLVHALPIFHGHGLCVALYTSLLRGSSVVLLPRFDPDA
ncbi:MAG TPA: AMP-binding protein, partial [Acidimicrobiales bacterium]